MLIVNCERCAGNRKSGKDSHWTGTQCMVIEYRGRICMGIRMAMWAGLGVYWAGMCKLQGGVQSREVCSAGQGLLQL